MNKLDTETQWMHIFAFRYALGRQSAAPGIVAEYIGKNLKQHTLFNLQLFDREITEYLKDPYGDTSDWIELQGKIQEELKSRAR